MARLILYSNKFVEFWDMRDSEKALQSTHGMEFAGGTLEVRVAFNSRRLHQLHVCRGKVVEREEEEGR